MPVLVLCCPIFSVEPLQRKRDARRLCEQCSSRRRSTNLPGFLLLQTKPFSALSVHLKTAAGWLCRVHVKKKKNHAQTCLHVQVLVRDFFLKRRALFPRCIRGTHNACFTSTHSEYNHPMTHSDVVQMILKQRETSTIQETCTSHKHTRVDSIFCCFFF